MTDLAYDPDKFERQAHVLLRRREAGSGPGSDDGGGVRTQLADTKWWVSAKLTPAVRTS